MVSGILAAVAVVLIRLTSCGIERASGYFALLLPITFHAQVEQPFYISSIHWFLWLLLIFIIMRHKVLSISLTITHAARTLGIALATGIMATSFYFLYHTSMAQRDIMNFVIGIDNPAGNLKVAMNNHYFKSYAEELAMRSILYNGIQSEDSDAVFRYIEWSINRIAAEPELKLFEDLINAYSYLNDRKRMCSTISEAASRYPTVKPLVALTKQCT